MRKLDFLFLLLFFSPFMAFAQQITIEGYVFESGNRGYLNLATVTIIDNETKALKGETQTDLNGLFQMGLAPEKDYLIRVTKKPFEVMEQVVSTKGKKAAEKVFVKFELKRMPGYLFEVTLAPTRSDEDIVVDAITGAWIEVYNNTTENEEFSLKNHPQHTFSCRFEQGNHYTMLIRKDGFFNKRLEAYVNVAGCILCFDGVGEVKPGVADVLTEGFEMGTLLANVELQPIELNKEIEINNIYYDLNSARVKTAGRKELDQLAVLLKDNTNLLVEIGSHTDSRGDDPSNKKLSTRRARAVVKYLVDKGIPKDRLVAKGYGESQLRNRCKNKVKCSEKEHQENRRTELKVLGFVHQNLSDDRTLAEMKEGEALEKMLAELDNSEIKIEAGAELPAEIKKQIEHKESKLPVKENTVDKPVVETNVQTQQNRPQSKPKRTPSFKKQPVPKTNPSVERRTLSAQERPTYNSPSIRDREEPEVPFDESFNEEEFTEPKDHPLVVSDIEVNTLQQIRKPSPLKADYNGYKIEVVTSVYKLPKSHDLFSRHGNIVLEETKRGTLAYLLGDFKNEEDAREFMMNVLIERYPRARVVKYSKGRRVVN